MTRCVVGICVYNVTQWLPTTFKHIEALKLCFSNLEVIFSYDNSADNTLDLIQQYAKNNNNITIIKSPKLLSDIRTVNIANARNRILEYIRQYFINYKYFIMLDCNNRQEGKLNTLTLKRYLKSTAWDALSFNNKTYYDIWALSIKPFYISCWHWSKPGSGVVKNMSNYIQYITKQCGNNELITCTSAFNGIAIYRMNKFINCNYYGLLNKQYMMLLGPDIQDNINAINLNNNSNLTQNHPVFGRKDDCEHRNFHFEAILKNRAKIRISPLPIFI